MRIAISSTQCNGKSTLIDSFLKRWPMYKLPEKTYRDLIKEKNLVLNREGNQESQTIIRDSLADQAMLYSSEDKIIHDRCILDNLAYTLYLAEKGIIEDEQFIADSILMTRETIKMYDIIFFLPLSDKSPVIIEEDENRDVDLKYRLEINNIFLGIESSYKEVEGIVFPLEDCPALIPIEGDELHFEKTNMIADYLDDDGEFKSTDEPLMKSLSEVAQDNAMIDSLINQVS